MNKTAAALLLALAASLGGRAHAVYQASCSAGSSAAPVTNASVISSFGEPRPDTGMTPTNVRYHGGVDIGECSQTNLRNVFSILAGNRQTPTVCVGGSTCVRIRDSATHAFDYEHISISTSLTTSSTVTIPAGTLLGTVLSGFTLHLQETAGVIGTAYRFNPERPNALDFDHSGAPSFTQTSITGAANQSLILLPESSTYPDGRQSNPTAFKYRNGTFYVKGNVEVLVAASGGSGVAADRKGVFAAGYVLSPPAKRPASYNIAFMQIADGPTITNDYWTTYMSSNPTGITHIASNMKLNGVGVESIDATWNTNDGYPEGLARICGFIKDFPDGHINQSACSPTYVDNTPPPFPALSAAGAAFTIATATPVVTIQGIDLGGIYSIKLAGGVSYSSTNYPTGVQTTASNQFPDTPGTLSDGLYTATILDLAGNTNTTTFIIATGNPSSAAEDDKGGAITNVIPSSRCVVIHATDTASGIASITFSGSGFTKTMNYTCGVPAKSTDVYSGAFCNLTENSTYTYTVTSCAGKQTTSPAISIATSTKGGVICVTSPAGSFCGSTGALSDAQLRTYGSRMRVCMSVWPLTCSGSCEAGWENIVTAPSGSTYCGTGPSCCRVISWDAPLGNKSFSVTNSTDVTSRDSGSYEFSVTTTASEGAVSIATLSSPNFQMNQGQSTSGTIDVAQIGQGYPTESPDGKVKVNSPFTRLKLFLQAIAEYVVGLAQQVLRPSSPDFYSYRGSDAIFNSTTTLTFTYVDTVNTDTTTVRIFMFDGVSWSSAGIINQSIAYSTSTQIITISASIDRTGLYATLYQANDSSAPVTTLTIGGAAYYFDGTLFVSTDTFLVLTATDPVVNGFASTVASMTYRIDPVSGSPFTIYTASISVSLGTHVIEYRSLDYAGNVEVIKTSTFTVTAGSAMRLSSTAQVPGTLLNGNLGSSAKVEVESQTENSTTLLISSANRQGMISVNNIGEVGIGATPQANLNIGTGEIGLQLRSGNSTSAVTSNQIAFGYNGDYSMRHLLRTEHSTATHGNKLDFLVWNTGAGSTAAVAGLTALSLQGITTASGGSFHVHPVGEPDAEVEVSNGLTTGGGTMQRLQVVSPSSRRFKTDIKELDEQTEDRALEDVVGLKHARFQYKVRQKDGSLVDDPAQPLHTGLIYEDAPESIRDGDGAISTTERLANVEMALKASMRRLEELQIRYEKLKAAKKAREAKAKGNGK